MHRALPPDRNRLTPRCSRSTGILLARFVVAVGLAIGVPAAWGQNLNRRPSAEQDAFARVYLPTERALTRAMTRARERLAAGEYHQALAFLQEVFSRDEDSFLERSDDGAEQVGLKATARQLIGGLPPEGQDVYELLHGATARRQLEAALESRDANRVAAVVRQYFHTSAGYEAALVLAQMETDQGHYLAAAQLYQELIDTPRAATRFEPQLSVRAALNYVAAARPALAAETLRSLRERHPAARIELSDKTTPALPPETDLADWLTQLVGEPLQTPRAESNWLTVRGDPARNTQSPGGRPHLRPRWEARVVNDPGVEAHLTGRSREFDERGIVAIPAARPIAVDGAVIMRTPRNLVAVDWQTGKRIWETRDDEELELEEAPFSFPGGIDDERFAGQGSSLEQRMWDDALVMSLASDGERVFVLRGRSAEPQDDIMALQVVPGLRRNARDVSTTTNRLAAYELKTQGKLVWEVDGGRMTGPLAGAFFLGAPLAIDDTLYVMAEIRSAVYLLALEPASGNVQWQQQLVGLEQGIALDPARGLIGASPSYGEGILVCPTAAGALIAIDVIKREFVWVYRYSGETRSAANTRNVFQPPIQSQSTRANNHWLDSSAIIADGRVFVTPPGSNELHCVDLQSGKMNWKRPQGEALFIGCVDQDRLLLVGSEALQAVHVSDGTPAWEPELAPLPPAALPAGHGYLSDGSYYLPLSTGEIAAVDMGDGKLTRFSNGKPAATLGNLICYRGSVISQSLLVLDKFEQLEVLQQRTAAALAENAEDATALRELAELKRADGETADAVKSLKRAYKLAPHDPLTRELLAELLLEALAADYAAFQEEVPIVAELIRDRTQQIELIRIEALGLEQLQRPLAAWDAYVRLADFTAEQPIHLRIDGDHTVRSDRWICGRLGMLWAEGGTEERETFAARLAARRESLSNSATAAELRHYLSHFDELPGASGVRRQLAQLLLERDRLAEAEIELLQIAGDEPEDEAEEDLAHAARLLKQLAKTDAVDAAWPRGHVAGKFIADGSRGRERARQAQAEQQGGLRQLRIEQDFAPGLDATQWFVSADRSEIVGRNVLGQDVFHVTINPSHLLRAYREANLVHGAKLGHLLFVTLGGQIVAIDSRQSLPGREGSLLWQAQQPGRSSAELIRARRTGSTPQDRGKRTVYHGWSGRKRMPGALGAAIGSLGPATPRGVVFQEQNELKCVDPLSGETLWVRTDIPAGCELFGDRELVFAADVSQREAHVVRVADGRRLGKRPLPRFEWLLTSGRNVAQLGFRTSQGGRTMLLRITDVWSQKTLFDAEYPVTSRTSVLEPDALAVYDPSGRFQLIDVPTGRVVIEQTLQAVPDLHSIQTLRLEDQYFLIVNRQAQHQQFHKTVGQQDYPLTNGLVYALSAKTGEPVWPRPATVRNRGIVLSQPAGVPFLVFADHKMLREGSSGGRLQLRLLCLDKRTGQTVYRNDSLPDSSVTRFRIRAERDAQPFVSIETNAGKVQLAITDRPRPPQPPANDDLEATRETAQRGLLGLGERILRGAIENPNAPGAERAGSEAPHPILDDD